MKYTVFFSFLLFCLVFLTCDKDKLRKNGYPVEIKKVDNVIHINNPEFPKNSPRDFLLKEELSIGNESDENYLFIKIKKLEVNEGYIYVADSRRCSVKIFDKHGAFIRSIAGKGEGPGELKFILDIDVDEENKMIHILDYKNRKIARYHFNGSFDSDIKIRDGSPDQFFLIQNDSYLVDYSYTDDKGNPKHRIIKYSLDGTRISQSKEFFESKDQVQEKGGWITSFKTPFEARSYFACDQRGFLYYGFSDNYEIAVFDPALNKSRVLTKNNPEKRKVSKEEIKSVLDALKERTKKRGLPFNPGLVKFPDYHPLFSNIWLDDRDRLLVNTRITDDKAYIDVFNREGVYEEKMIINAPADTTLAWVFHKPVFKNGCIYSVVMNEEGMLLVKKYRLVEKDLYGKKKGEI